MDYSLPHAPNLELKGEVTGSHGTRLPIVLFRPDGTVFRKLNNLS